MTDELTGAAARTSVPDPRPDAAARMSAEMASGANVESASATSVPAIERDEDAAQIEPAEEIDEPITVSSACVMAGCAVKG